MKTLHSIAALCSILLLVSCTPKPEESILPPEEAIIGKWHNEVDENIIAEFFEDGTMAFMGRNLNYGGRYEFIGGDKIRIDSEVKGVVKSVVFEFSHSAHRLTLTSTNGEMGRYRREK